MDIEFPTENYDPANDARGRLKKTYERFLTGHAAIVHFSTGLLGANREAVPVNHIAAYFRVNGNPYCKFFDSRSSHDAVVREEDAIRECLHFFIKKYDRLRIIVWRNNPSWGFDHIVRRLGNLSSTAPPLAPSIDRFIDLDQHIKDIYGDGYAPHDRFGNCVKQNSIKVANLLTFPETKVEFANGNFENLRMNTTAKCKAIAGILEKLVNGTFVTALGTAATQFPPPSPPSSLQRLTGNALKAAEFIKNSPGASAKQIARHCGVEESTVRSHYAKKLLNRGFTSHAGPEGGYFPPQP